MLLFWLSHPAWRRDKGHFIEENCVQQACPVALSKNMNFRAVSQKADQDIPQEKSIQRFADRKVKIQAAEGKLRNKLQLSHLLGNNILTLTPTSALVKKCS